MEQARQVTPSRMRLRYERWRRIFGPVFFYDLVRTSRQGQIIAHRCLYACLLAGVLFLAYHNRFGQAAVADLFRSPTIGLPERANFAASFFTNQVILQFVVILLITPLYTAGAVVEERERRTLELLFTTELSNREIVMGKLAARLAKLLLLLFTGLPVLSLLQLLGGVDPSSLIAGFFACAMLMMSVGATSIHASVNSRTVLGATFLSYVQTFFVALLCVAPCWGLLGFIAPSWGGLWTLSAILGIYVLTHGFLAWISCRAAIYDLRPFRRKRAPPTPTDWEWAPIQLPNEGSMTSFPDYGAGAKRPPISDNALLWKERYVEPSLRSAPAVQTFGFVWLGLLLLALGFSGQIGPGMERGAQSWLRALEVAGAFIWFLLVALSAANRVTRERERQTLDSLLTLPYTDGEILFSKWLASILVLPPVWWALAAIWLIGVVTGAIHPSAVPFLAAAVTAYLIFFASLGIFFSTSYHSSLRANLFTLLSVLLLLAGPASYYGWLSGPYVVTAGGGGSFPWDEIFVEYGLSPAGTLWALTFRSADLLDPRDGQLQLARIFAAVVGLHCYLAAAVALWFLARAGLCAAKGPRHTLPTR
jgi:ABC-type transport system involved in multi-copper enzyme maturation permease subunit